MSYRSNAIDETTKKKKVSYAYYPKNKNPHPSFIIEGKFLETYGFKIGDVVEVEMRKRKIVITKT